MPKIKYCAVCSKEYTCSPSKFLTRKYCGKECSQVAAIKYPNRNNLVAQYQKAWEEKNPENTKQRNIKRFKKYYNTDNGRAEHMLNNARGRADRKKLECTLTKEWILDKLQSGKCEVTNIPFVLESNGGKGHKQNSFSPSIDRINQTGPYTPQNCRITVWIYNRARGAFPDGDFDKLISSLHSS